MGYTEERPWNLASIYFWRQQPFRNANGEERPSTLQFQHLLPVTQLLPLSQQTFRLRSLCNDNYAICTSKKTKHGCPGRLSLSDTLGKFSGFDQHESMFDAAVCVLAPVIDSHELHACKGSTREGRCVTTSPDHPFLSNLLVCRREQEATAGAGAWHCCRISIGEVKVWEIQHRKVYQWRFPCVHVCLFSNFLVLSAR